MQGITKGLSAEVAFGRNLKEIRNDSWRDQVGDFWCKWKRENQEKEKLRITLRVGIWPGRLRSQLGYPQPISKCLGLSPSSTSNPSSLLKHITCWEVASYGCGTWIPTTMWNTWIEFLAPGLSWPRPRHYRHRGVNQQMGAVSVCMSLSCVCMSAFNIN